jgi:gas vesicle protein
MNPTWTHRDDGFVIGLLTGACVGAGLAIWLAPRLVSALRQGVFDSARRLSGRAAEQSQHVGTRVVGAVDELVRKARGGRGEVADAVACDAHDVEGFATRETPRGLLQSGVRIKIRPDWSYIRDVNAKAF